MAIAKIWKNRIEAGTKILADCPQKYRSSVIGMIHEDIVNNEFTATELNKLVEDGKLTPDEYEEILNF